jgi:signal transduction histidine kinase
VLGEAGLELAIVKYIIEAHGGTVRAKSEVGIGTTFSIRLPLAENTDENGAMTSEVVALALRT